MSEILFNDTLWNIILFLIVFLGGVAVGVTYYIIMQKKEEREWRDHGIEIDLRPHRVRVKVDYKDFKENYNETIKEKINNIDWNERMKEGKISSILVRKY